MHIKFKENIIFVSFREKRLGNNLYQELSFQDTDALGEVDEGADLTGKLLSGLLFYTPEGQISV
jgi:hypothetical protein